MSEAVATPCSQPGAVLPAAGNNAETMPPRPRYARAPHGTAITVDADGIL
jgi:hypothetical protein